MPIVQSMGRPNTSLKLTRWARPKGGAPGPPSYARIDGALLASVGQLSSRTLGGASIRQPVKKDFIP